MKVYKKRRVFASVEDIIDDVNLDIEYAVDEIADFGLGSYEGGVDRTGFCDFYFYVDKYDFSEDETYDFANEMVNNLKKKYDLKNSYIRVSDCDNEWCCSINFQLIGD